MQNGRAVQEEEVDLDKIDDEQTLIQMLDATEDFDDRKLIRARLKEVQAVNRAKRDEMLRKRENDREMTLRKKVQDADEHKRRTMQMYDQMAKSAPAGGRKVMNAEILRNSDGSSNNSSSCSSPVPVVVAPQRDLVEEAIRDHQKAADTRKKRILAAYDAAQQSGPAGSERIVDFTSFSTADVSDYVPNTSKPEESFCTFAMSGGVPKLVKEPPKPPPKVSARAKFQQMDSAAAQNQPARTAGSNFGMGGVARSASAGITRSPSGGMGGIARSPSGGIARSASDIKDMLLRWCKSKTREYETYGVNITNFSSSWSDGLAFCALIHHFYPDAFDFSTLNAKNRRKNFELAFKTAEEKADIAPLLDVDDMIMMKNKPDWKCVFCYVQSFYRRFRDED